MFRQGQLAVHGLAILLGRNEAAISNRGKFFLHHAVHQVYKMSGTVCPNPPLAHTLSAYCKYRSNCKSTHAHTPLPNVFCETFADVTCALSAFLSTTPFCRGSDRGRDSQMFHEASRGKVGHLLGAQK